MYLDICILLILINSRIKICLVQIASSNNEIINSNKNKKRDWKMVCKTFLLKYFLAFLLLVDAVTITT